MFNLELKIPPLLIMLILGLLMWLLSITLPGVEVSFQFRLLVTLIFFISGTLFSLSGLVSFKLANTTVNPMKPNESSFLVTSGVYKISRNPMYVGFLFFLMGLGAFLSNLYVFLMPIIFVIYMNKFQIEPEEEFLLTNFGKCFVEYKQKVRRWL